MQSAEASTGGAFSLSSVAEGTSGRQENLAPLGLDTTNTNADRFGGFRRRASNLSANVRQKAVDSGVAARAANLSANVREKAATSGLSAKAANLSANVRERAATSSANVRERAATSSANIRLARSAESSSENDPDTALTPAERRLEELRSRVRRMDVLVERVRKNTEKSLNRTAEQAAREEQRQLEQDGLGSPAGGSGEGGQRKRMGWPRTPARNGRGAQQQAQSEEDAASAAFFSALIVPVGPRDTAEMAEIVRRFVEIILEDERGDGDDDDEGGGGGEGDEDPTGPAADAAPPALQRAPTMGAFDLFTEMDALSLVSSILTGEAFRPEDARFSKAILLPPPSVARELLHSLSRLLRDVSQDATLFLLLSNTDFRGLVDLPLELYGVAKALSRGRLQDSPLGRRMANKGGNGGGGNMDGANDGIGGGGVAMMEDAEGSSMKEELLGSFVGFLKGMSVRMRPETTQFFLVYPEGDDEAETESVASKNIFPEEIEPSASNEHYGANSLRNFTENYDEDYGEVPAGVDDGPDAAAGGLTAPASPSRPTTPKPPPEEKKALIKVRNIEFPLYARTLQLLSLDHSDLVRLSAVSICLDIVQLVTSDDSEIWRGAGEDSRRERMEVARYLCSPANVHCLVAPNATRLVSLCDSLEEQVRQADAVTARSAARKARERIVLGGADGPRPMLSLSTTTSVEAWGAAQDPEPPQSPMGGRKLNGPTLEEEGQVLKEGLKKTLTNVEVELQLLEGILQAGLTSLNEQVVENVLSTYVRRLIRPLAALSLESQSRPNLPLLLSNIRREGTRCTAGDFADRVCDTLLPAAKDIDVSGHHPSGGGDNTLATVSATSSAATKASLICLAALFYNNPDNPPLINLTFAAAFHPNGIPDRPEEDAVECAVEVFESNGKGAKKLRTDGKAAPLCYDFGRSMDNGTDDASSAGGKDRVAFAWSHALAIALEGVALSPTALKPNRARETLAACLAHTPASGDGGASALRPFALLVADAALGAVSANVADAVAMGKDCVRRRTSVNSGGASSCVEAAKEVNSVFSGASTSIMTEMEDDSSSACSSLTRGSEGKVSSSAKVKDISRKLKKKGKKGMSILKSKTMMGAGSTAEF